MKNRVPFYDIANKFFVGAVFLLLTMIIVWDDIPIIKLYKEYSIVLKEWKAVASAILLVFIYEIGFIINRSSSILIEPILNITRIWPKNKYDSSVSRIKKHNHTFSALITELVLIRSHILMYLILSSFALICSKYVLFASFLCVIIILILSGRKHNLKINTIKNDYTKELSSTNRGKNNRVRKKHVMIYCRQSKE